MAIRGTMAAAAMLLFSLAPSVLAEQPASYCAYVGTDDTLRRIPADLVPAVNALLHTNMSADIATRMTFFRCADAHVLICGVGANLPCGKADISRSSEGGARWCRAHPDALFIPAYATGHATIFTWRCLNGEATIVQQRYQVDARGFVAEYWHQLP